MKNVKLNRIINIVLVVVGFALALFIASPHFQEPQQYPSAEYQYLSEVITTSNVWNPESSTLNLQALPQDVGLWTYTYLPENNSSFTFHLLNSADRLLPVGIKVGLNGDQQYPDANEYRKEVIHLIHAHVGLFSLIFAVVLLFLKNFTVCLFKSFKFFGKIMHKLFHRHAEVFDDYSDYEDSDQSEDFSIDDYSYYEDTDQSEDSSIDEL